MELSARGYANFCEVSRDSVRGRIGAEKIFFLPCKYFARMRVVLYVSDTEKITYETTQQPKGVKAMFGLTALVITLIGTTVVGCGTGFAIVCATES